ncbi:MAG: single-strand DNA-binding protein [Candidatus Saganbacteria bacterium]|uniref:Single-stranded DNA-binding protein n=1 Tax=Candidatus Saganbacteria bacterium TaxID=2575572 RepID=A0A833KZL0_UNCSA|nr:MAG: single-strand DNA-binding protein [Candidatus Saganbacteria bacterium]
MYNKAFIIGNLTRDPDVRCTPSGINVARFTVAVNRPKKKGEAGKDDVDYIPVTAWRRLAEICGEYLKKGQSVAIVGPLQVRSYKDKTGETRIIAEIVADQMQMLGKKANTAAPAETSDDVPF